MEFGAFKKILISPSVLLEGWNREVDQFCTQNLFKIQNTASDTC